MALVTKRASDITGAEAAEAEFATVFVRQHPKVQDSKRIDALPAELEQFKGLTDLVVLEVKMPDGTTKELAVKYADFSKVMPDDKLTALPGLKGRQPGFSPKANGNGH